jgi:hypothetical protein
VARPNALVDDVRELSRALETHEAPPDRPARQYSTVTFAGGRQGLLDMTVRRSAVWADVLQSRRETGQPAYVEIDPDSGLITKLLLPNRYTVSRIEPSSDDGVEVELVVSHARHYLRRFNPDFDELRQTLEAALEHGTPVLVTETLDEHEIIDVRPLDEPTEVQG